MTFNNGGSYGFHAKPKKYTYLVLTFYELNNLTTLTKQKLKQCFSVLSDPISARMTENTFQRRGHRNQRPGNKANNVDENNLTIKQFQIFACELNEKHDLYEKIVKHGRDITIESKRIIFLLHTIDSSKNNQDKVLDEARERLLKLCKTSFLAISKELIGKDPYQFTRAYSAGLQEFVEAFTFYQFLSHADLSDWEILTSGYLTFNEDNQQVVTCMLPPIEYMLGLLDMTGELMRKCINSLGSGDVDSCFESCDCLRSLYTGFMSIGNTHNREWSRKIYTLKQSLSKAENVCYNVKVRGKEAAKWAAAGKSNTETIDHISDDEGVF